ncbi:isoamyl acetate-hydrolyzing esterase 1 homolog [Carassius gibelio]|uniref:isoamyl acetate-hydrolyzing esterase 1 homolog n=1 Tax=Carassius gibelio TaxID=101364 RepID=UPI002279C7A7|nr:isoamyl acetate-hydrolyzing esterase 1 homolog [Carassius gibelio]
MTPALRVSSFPADGSRFTFQANGWGSEISHKVARKCDVVNRGLSGYNTRWAKFVLPRTVPISDAAIAAVTVFFGANDCALEDKNPLQHVPLQEFTENLKDVLKYLVTIGVSKEKIIFITPPPLNGLKNM